MLLTEGASGRSGSKPGKVRPEPVRAEPDGDGDDAAGVSGSAMAGPPCAVGAPRRGRPRISGHQVCGTRMPTIDGSGIAKGGRRASATHARRPHARSQHRSPHDPTLEDRHASAQTPPGGTQASGQQAAHAPPGRRTPAGLWSAARFSRLGQTWAKHAACPQACQGPRLRVAHKRLRVHGPDGPARVPRAPPGQRGGALQAARQVALRPAQLPRQRRLHLGRAPAAGVRPALLQQAWRARRRGRRPRQLFCVDECGLLSRLARPPKHWQTSSSFPHLLLATKIIRPAARRMPRQRAAAARHDLICFKARHPAARRRAAGRRRARGGSRTDRVLQVDRAQRAFEEQAAVERGAVAIPDAHLVVGAHRRHRVVPRQLPPLHPARRPEPARLACCPAVPVSVAGCVAARRPPP